MRPVASGPIYFAVFQHDAAIFALILVLYAAGSAVAKISSTNGPRHVTLAILAKACVAASLVIAFLYAADAFDYYFFTTRLYATDVVTFSAEPRAVQSLLHSGWTIIIGHPRRFAAVAGAMLLLMRCYWALLAKPICPPVRGRFIGATAVALVVLWCIHVPGYVYSFGDKTLYENFMERNENFFVHGNFSDGFRAKLSATTPVKCCIHGRGNRVNVVLVIVESLSAYDSQYFSGVEDWTPRLDEIAKRETALPNFYANGWTTIGGLVSLLGQTYPFVPERTKFNTWGSPRLMDFCEIQNPLPQRLAEQGYSTEFVGGGDLTFLDQDRWLRTIGFQKIVGETDLRFAQEKVRGPFRSVPDRTLYEVALDELHGMRPDKPYFLVVQTFWSHRPFMDPNGGKLDGEEYVMREADAQIGALYEKLMAAGFFEHGLLFITGDHRAMEPFRKEEFDRFGASAVARIPAVVVTKAIKLPAVIKGDFQQRDFGASVETLVDKEYYLSPEEGSFLSDPPKPADCALYSRGDDRDLIFAKCGSQEATIKVSGDSTRVVTGAISDVASVIQTINRTRVRPQR